MIIQILHVGKTIIYVRDVAVNTKREFPLQTAATKSVLYPRNVQIALENMNQVIESVNYK